MCLNLGLPLKSVTRWLAFQIIQSYEVTRMNLGIQGSRSMFIILFKTGRGPPFLIYRSPSSTLVWFDEFVVMMDRVQNSKHHNEILLLGDFNSSNPIQHGLSTLSLFNLHQCIQSPTRVTSTTSTLIDHNYICEQS